MAPRSTKIHLHSVPTQKFVAVECADGHRADVPESLAKNRLDNLTCQFRTGLFGRCGKPYRRDV